VCVLEHGTIIVREVRDGPDSVLHDGAHFRVQRAHRSDGLPIVLKTLKAAGASDEALVRFRREYRLLSRSTLPGVIKAYDFVVAPEPTMVLEDIGGTSLDRMSAPLPLAQFLELASGVADALASLHASGIVHRHLIPANIVFNASTGQCRLIDFALADVLPARAMQSRPPTALEGTLAFSSPEQTGRINRPVDYRTDFYSLGITFYWLLTGTLPFEAADALGLVHRHLAATPEPPHVRNPDIPEGLSRIVLKLMAKTAEERYQGGRGLKADLEHCLRALRQEGRVPSFEPGLEDVRDVLQLPHRLYGREAETKCLLAAFDAAVRGACKVLFIGGYSGVGKTALVREAYRPVLERQGYFLEGKFDQLRRNVPYSAFAQALDGFVDQLLGEDEPRVTEWRRVVLGAVRASGRVLTEVIPGLERLIGPQPRVPPLGVGEAQNRFVFLFVELMAKLASPEHPLVLFLDDLQWIDAASLELLLHLVRAGRVRGLLVVGGYRDNEIDALHPLHATMEVLRAPTEAGLDAPEVLALGPLPEGVLNELVADALRATPTETAPLARVVHEKTGGNAFFALQMLKSLAESDAMAFEPTSRRWRWDLAAIGRLEIADDVVALMEAKIRALPEPAQRLLPLMACLGYRFCLTCVVLVAGRTPDDALAALQPALAEGLIVPIGAQGFQFAHDRVRQAAYALVPDAEKERMHLTVGRLLLPVLEDPAKEEHLFIAADNLDAGVALLTDDAERVAVAELNLRAGIKAKTSAAFPVAAHYLRHGLALLPADKWTTHYALTLALHEENALCEYVAGSHELADALIATALEHAASVYDKADIYAIQVVVHTTQNRFADALASGLTALRLFGVDLPDASDELRLRAASDRAITACRERRRGRDLAAIIDAPEMTDRDAKACMDLLVHTVLAAYFSNRALYALLAATMTELSLRHGNSSAGALGYVLMAGISVAELRDPEGAKALGELALAVNARYPDPALEGKILMFYANTVAPWFLPLAEAEPLLRRGLVAALDAGALNDAANCWWGLARNALASGAPLDAVIRTCDGALAFAERIRDPGFHTAFLFMRGVARLLKGELPNPPSINEGGFREHAFVDLMNRSGFLSTLAHYYVFKSWSLFALGRLDEARPFVEQGAAMLGCIADQPHVALHAFHQSLLLLVPGRAPSTSDERARVAANQERLEVAAAFCPANYLHLYLLVEAERARDAARFSDAAALFDRAIDAAAESGTLYVEGTASEWAGRFWLAQAREDLAAPYLERARRAYGRWQAHAKVRALDDELGAVLGRSGARPRADEAVLDVETLMKMTRAISGEMELQRLTAALMRIVIESAGAQRGVLLLEENATWEIVARGELGANAVEVSRPLDMDRSDLVAAGVVRYVARTRERVVLDDAAAEEQFADDPHLRARRTKSLLCAPVLGRGRLMGIFYLENDLTTGAFTHARVQLLEMLLAQTAISLENARIYEALRRSEARYRRIVDTAMEGIIVLDPGGVITVANARVAQLIGYTPEEMVGRRFATLLFEEDAPDHVERQAARRRGVSETYERRLRCKDGGTVWTLVSASPILEGERFEGSFGMFTDITDRLRAEKELVRTNRFLRTLSRCNETLVHATDERALLRDVCRVVVDVGGFALAWVGCLETDGSLTVAARVDARGSNYLADGERVGDASPHHARCPARRAVVTGQIQVVQDVAGDESVAWRERAARFGYASAVALPFRSGGSPIGVFSIEASETGAFGPDEVALLSELAGDLGYGIEGLRVRRDREEYMQKLAGSMRSTVQALSNTVEVRDPYTAGHQRRVAELAAAVAQRMGWSEERAQAIFLAGMVHDIGKIAVPSEILSKPGRLSSAEMLLVRTHAEAGYEVLKGVDFPWPIAQIVREHHERLDGSGYPQGLKGDAILIEARVLAVCDVVEAMTTHRPYRPGLGLDLALHTIEQGRGTLFEPEVVDHCLRVIREAGFRFD
jgi:PAS domain S-box-containing protein